MSKWYENDDKVKSLFDGIRNYIYCGVILYVGVWTGIRPEADIFVIILGAAFSLLALYLFWVNTRIMERKLFRQPRESLKGTIVISLISSLFLLLGFSLLLQQLTTLDISDIL
ncbi:hypothetical protein Q7142_002211 [Vibrio parahaemolyticus]|nr:hypothetical protein [Vibrio parahaemolyticus]HBC3984365.1 hypothetical protein [Vibrio parahaemolyticus]HCG8131157.1 hypothetical protein [Vibrio parahaemolyticus]